MPKTYRSSVRKVRHSRRPRKGAVAKLVRQVKQIKKTLPETHYVDNGLIQIAFSNAGVFSLMNGIQVGDNLNNRQGDQTVIRSIRLCGHVVLTGDATATGTDYIKLLLIWDTQPNGAAPTLAQITQSTDQANNNNTTSYAMRNRTYVRRFRILMEKHWSRPPIGAATTVANASNTFAQLHSHRLGNMVDFRKRCNLRTTYSANSNPSVVADIVKGSLYLFAVGLNGAPQYRFDGFMRLAFSE